MLGRIGWVTVAPLAAAVSAEFDPSLILEGVRELAVLERARAEPAPLLVIEGQLESGRQRLMRRGCSMRSCFR